MMRKSQVWQQVEVKQSRTAQRHRTENTHIKKTIRYKSIGSQNSLISCKLFM